MDTIKEHRTAQKILIVDDEPNIRKVISKILEKNSSHIIDSAFDGIDALEKWSLNQYDLMIVDLKMPRMDGETLIKEIRAKDLDIPIIVFTGHADFTDAFRLLEQYDIAEFINKPLPKWERFLFSIENALEKYRLRKELREEVAARKKVDDALQENRRMLMNLMSNLQGMAYRRQADSEWSMEFVSEGCFELTGCSPDQLLSGDSKYNFFKLIHPADISRIVDIVDNAIKESQPFKNIYRIVTPQGDEKWVLEQGRGVYDRQGTLLAVEGFIADISKQKETEKEIEKALAMAEAASRTKTEFIAKMSHEMRTPLNAIIGFSELSLALATHKDLLPYTKYILVESKILLELINSLLDHAKISTGSFELNPKPFNLYRLMKDIEAIMVGRAGKRNLDFYCEINCPNPTVVNGDEGRLRQVLHNLLSNAVKFTETGHIKIKADLISEHEGATTVKFSVEDTGIGIPLERQPYIFEGFNQTTDLEFHKYGGTGLGTTISKELVELMGGEIDFESIEMEGSTFWFTVALTKVENQEIIDQVLAKQSLEDKQDFNKRWNARVLLAEDYKTNQVVAIKNLELAGCDVELAENGKEAVDLFDTRQFDLILMDLNMPVMDGFAASHIIREREKDTQRRTPIIAYTANVYEDDKEKCQDSGMDDFLAKPIQQTQLFTMLHKWLDPSLQRDEEIDLPSFPLEEAKKPVNTEFPMNKDEALKAFAGDAETLDYVIGEYFKAMEDQFKLIKEAITSGDFDTVSSEAHSIKGGALTLAADDLASAALKLEKSGKSKEEDRLTGLLQEVETQKQRLETFYNSIKPI